MDYAKSAELVLKEIGGSANLSSAAHCATRLRLVVNDDKLCNVKEIENIDGVKGVFFASGQLQVIFGTGTVNKVYDQFIEKAGVAAASKEEVKVAAGKKSNIFFRMIKSLGDVFVPIIPAIVASGLLMGLLEGCTRIWPSLSSSVWYSFFHLISNAAFVFLPVLIAMSAAKVFKCNMFLGAVIGMIMIHPDLTNAWGDVSNATVLLQLGSYAIKMVGYQGHVIPVIIAVWLLSQIENRLHKVVPEIIDLFVTPLVSVTVTAAVTLLVVGPIFGQVETWVLQGAKWLISIPFGIGGFVVGAAYAPTVVVGVHHMYNVIEAGFLAQNAANIWMPIATAANVAQGAAALAVGIKTKNKKLKSLALPASLSAFLGITEPAIFGVNIRYKKAFIAGIIGGAVGGLFASLMKVGASAYGVTGVFGLLITLPNTEYGLSNWNIVFYLLTIVIASVVAFIASWFMFKDDKETVESKADEPVKPEDTQEANELTDTDNVYAPINGEVIDLTMVNDPTFASLALGDGLAIKPSDGKVYAPFDGKVETLFETKHAIGLSNGKIDLLIHIGINTVALEGKYFTAHVAEGDVVKKGQLLIEFDKDAIEKEGYETVTPVIVTNELKLTKNTESQEVGATIITVE